MTETTSVSERALLLLEIVAKAEEPPTLNDLVAQLGLPKATTHRFIVLLEQLGFAQRTLDGRRYEIGHRLTALALDAMQHSFQLAPRRAILSALVAEIGETCNITMLEGDHLIYLDRVESDWPLQFRLKVGSRVPLHCTASGKLFLALAPDVLSRTLLNARALERHTPGTITSPGALEKELAKIRKTRIGTDNEEFIEGMAAAAVPVMDSKGRICATVAVHGPTGRLPLARAIALAPALKKAASAIEKTFHLMEDSRRKKSAQFNAHDVTA
ncbi:MAG: IclR family transcriptional regulator [Bradyrhizobiaceae bacterium]|nr:MAG: IclR family transcriptional regulator [Bradyrhizobiaceae bacterium]